MPIKVTCSNCGGVLHAPDDAGGKRGRCPTCGNILPIPAEAPRASAAALPDPPAKGTQRAPSFGDFAIGPQVGPPPGEPAGGRSSIPGLGEPPMAEPRKASAAALGTKAKPEPRRATDPFARKGSPTTTEGPATDGVVRAWKRAKSGLGWVWFAAFLFLIPAILLPGQMIAEYFTKKPLLSNEIVPVLKLPQSTAVPVLVAVVPVLLGLICLLIGRLGFSNVPRRACAKGPALLSVLATIVVLGGALAVCFPSVAFLLSPPLPPVEVAQPPANAPGGTGQLATAPPPAQDAVPLDLFGADDASGVIQRFGLLIGAVMLIVGEFWFASAIGRVGSALGDAKTAARSTRYLMWLGLAVAISVGVVGLAPTEFGFGSTAEEVSDDAGRMVRSQWVKHVAPLFANLGEYQPLLKPGVFLLGGLFVGVGYLRMVGAARGAIREWLNRNATA